jgi:hypothetical protein
MTNGTSEGPSKVQNVQNIHFFRSMALWVSTNAPFDAEYDGGGEVLSIPQNTLRFYSQYSRVLTCTQSTQKCECTFTFKSIS